MLGLLCICALKSLASAAPAINLPINAQVPPVARIGEPFDFTFSPSTFKSTSDTIRYTLSNAPPWLALSGPSRTISGTPTQYDSGSVVVDLIADDDTGSVTMPVTLVVATQPGPALGLSVADQLPAFGPFSSPSSILLAPSSALSISLSSITFTNTNSETVYYATSSDNTPLPSWIHFDPLNLSFSGTTPQIDSSANTSQSFGIELTASNVVGFADVTMKFLIVVESHLLSFNTNVIVLNVSEGLPLNDSTLLSALSVNGRQATPSDIKQTSATLPSWLSLNPQTLAFSGYGPKNFSGQNFTITIMDNYGDSATTMVVLQPIVSSTTSLLNPIGTANATEGSEFVYYLSQTINASDVELVIDLGTASAWLEFERSTQSIKGHVPNDLKPQQVVVNITAREGSQTQSEILTIAVQNTTRSPTPLVSPTISSGSGPTGSIEATTTPHAQLATQRRGWLPAAIIVPLAALSGLAALMVICWRRRRRPRRRYSDDQSNASSQNISRPIMLEKDFRTGNVRSKRTSSRFSLAPRIPRTWASAVGKRNSKNRVSDLSFGDRGQRPDSWQTFTAGLAHSEDRVIEGFSRIPEEPGPKSWDRSAQGLEISRMEASARLVTNAGDGLLRKHSKRRRERSSMSLRKAAPLYGPAIGGFGHGKPDSSRVQSNAMFGSRVDRYRNGPLGQMPQRFGTVQESWRNYRRETPESWTDTSEGSSEHHVSYDARDHHRRQYTIRPVLPPAALSIQSTDTWNRPLAPTRNPKRARPRRSTNPFMSAGSLYGEKLRQSSSKSFPDDSWLTTPPPESKASLEHDRRLFEARTFPRPVDSEDDARYKSAVPSEAQSMYEEREIGEESSDDQRAQWRSTYQNPLRANPVEQGDVQAGLSAAMYAGKRKSRPWDELAHKLNQQIEELDKIGSRDDDDDDTQHLGDQSTDRPGTPEDDSYVDDDATMASQSEPSVNVQMVPRGQRLGRQLGMRQDDPGNRSMRGEIKHSGSISFL